MCPANIPCVRPVHLLRSLPLLLEFVASPVCWFYKCYRPIWCAFRALLTELCLTTRCFAYDDMLRCASLSSLPAELSHGEDRIVFDDSLLRVRRYAPLRFTLKSSCLTQPWYTLSAPISLPSGIGNSVRLHCSSRSLLYYTFGAAVELTCWTCPSYKLVLRE